MNTPILAIGASDAPWGMPAVREAIMDHLVRAPVETSRARPAKRLRAERPSRFLCSRFRGTLWPGPAA
ncbi:hypothetical protein [Hoeflea sp.]|uniref:hypothetical protein n=1 Tax=Hoeflea sp. TaxID=1940281 RepID=UPI003A956F10